MQTPCTACCQPLPSSGPVWYFFDMPYCTKCINVQPRNTLAVSLEAAFKEGASIAYGQDPKRSDDVHASWELSGTRKDVERLLRS